MTEQDQPTRVSRRSIAKGAAWAVPAIPLVVATPAYAASKCLTASFGAASCKGPGAGNNWSYKFEICFENTCTAPLTVYVNYLQNNSGALFVSCTNSTITNPILVPGGTPAKPGKVCIPVDWYRSTSSAGTVQVYGSYNAAVSDANAILLASVKTTGNTDSALGICGPAHGTNPCPA